MGWIDDFFDDEEYEGEYEEEVFPDMLIEDIKSFFNDKFSNEVYFVPLFVFVDKLENNNIIFNSLN